MSDENWKPIYVVNQEELLLVERTYKKYCIKEPTFKWGWFDIKLDQDGEYGLLYFIRVQFKTDRSVSVTFDTEEKAEEFFEKVSALIPNATEIGEL